MKRTFQVQLILSSGLTGQKPLADLPSATLPSCHLVQSIGQGRVQPKRQEVGRADATPHPQGERVKGGQGGQGRQSSELESTPGGRSIPHQDLLTASRLLLKET